MKNLLLIALLAIVSMSHAQKISAVKEKYRADAVWYITTNKSEADMLLYNSDQEYEAGDGVIVFVKDEYRADEKIYFTQRKSEADKVIFFVDYKSQINLKCR